jgi:hypothetical protein
LGQDDHSQIALIRQAHLSSRINSSPAAYIEKTLSAGGINFDLYALPEAFDERIFDRAKKVRKVESFQGMSRPVVAKHVEQIIDYVGIEILPRIAIRLAFNPVGFYEWGFNRQTLHAETMTSLSFNDSGIAGVLDLMISMGNERTSLVLERLIEHREHFVRWKAIQALAKVDGARGRSAVETALTDPHPDIRAAAQKTLALLN